LKADGTVVAWGPFVLGQNGVPAGLTDVAAIAAGDDHNLVLKRDGTIVSWGFDTAGQCEIPPGLTGVVTIAARGNHNMVVINERPLTPSRPNRKLSKPL